MEYPILILLAATLVVTAANCVIILRQAHALQALRLLAEQTQAGLRAENETTRNALRTNETTGAERLAGLRGALDVSTEQIRTALSRDQGELRLALAEGQAKTTEQTGAQFETVRQLLELKLRELREGNEAKLAEIHKTVNEQLHAAVEKQMGESFNRVIDQFTAVQKAMGDVQAVTAQIGDIKRLFSNVKTRGGWGETQVKAMLDDILPPGAYETNKKVRPDSDDVVEFAVIMPMRGENRPLLPIELKISDRGLRSPPGRLRSRRHRGRTDRDPHAGAPGARRGPQDRDQIHRSADHRGVRDPLSADRRTVRGGRANSWPG